MADQVVTPRNLQGVTADGADNQGGATEALTPPISRPAIKVTRKNIAKIPERHLIENIDPMLTEAFIGLRQKIKDGNVRCIELALHIVNLIKPPGGVTVTNNLLQQNNNKTENTSVSFESLVRKLEKRNLSATNVIDVTPE